MAPGTVFVSGGGISGVAFQHAAELLVANDVLGLPVILGGGAEFWQDRGKVQLAKISLVNGYGNSTDLAKALENWQDRGEGVSNHRSSCGRLRVGRAVGGKGVRGAGNDIPIKGYVGDPSHQG